MQGGDNYTVNYSRLQGTVADRRRPTSSTTAKVAISRRFASRRTTRSSTARPTSHARRRAAAAASARTLINQRDTEGVPRIGAVHLETATPSRAASSGRGTRTSATRRIIDSATLTSLQPGLTGLTRARQLGRRASFSGRDFNIATTQRFQRPDQHASTRCRTAPRFYTQFDADGNGTITAAEMGSAPGVHQHRRQPEQADQLRPHPAGASSVRS